MGFRVVIPARYGAVRLPGKPLLDLTPPDGPPMLYWVHRIAVDSGAAEVLIATEDERIRAAAGGFGGRAVLTSAAHVSGTDRIAEVAHQRGWSDSDIVINLQGDQPMMPPALLGQVAGLLASHDGADMATLATPIGSLEEFLDPARVKVVADAGGRALYFSRAPIPWGRDTARAGLASQQAFRQARLHVGLYAYRVAALRRLSLLPPSPLEQVESLEQLRALENGMEIRVADALAGPGPSVDTAEDLARVRRMMAGRERHI